MKRKLVIFTLLIFSFSMLFAAPEPDFYKPDHKNFHGKRMMDNEKGFHLLFIKSRELPDNYSFGFVFSMPVNPKSINPDNFLLNGHKIPLANVRFSKDYRTIHFLVSPEVLIWMDQNNELIIKDIESINGKKIKPVVINDFQLETDYRLTGEFKK